MSLGSLSVLRVVLRRLAGRLVCRPAGRLLRRLLRRLVRGLVRRLVVELLLPGSVAVLQPGSIASPAYRHPGGGGTTSGEKGVQEETPLPLWTTIFFK